MNKYVMKANRVLGIEDDQLENYLKNGYAEIDEKGKVLTEAKKDDVKSLKKEIKALAEENAALKKKMEALKAN